MEGSNVFWLFFERKKERVNCNKNMLLYIRELLEYDNNNNNNDDDGCCGDK